MGKWGVMEGMRVRGRGGNGASRQGLLLFSCVWGSISVYNSDCQSDGRLKVGEWSSVMIRGSREGSQKIRLGKEWMGFNSIRRQGILGDYGRDKVLITMGEKGSEKYSGWGDITGAIVRVKREEEHPKCY